MNIFKNESDIFGNAAVTNLKGSLKEFLELACKIRTRLGRQGHLLDKYLSYLLETANHQLAYDSASEGFEYAAKLYLLCAGILRGKDEEHMDDPFHNQAKVYIESHPLHFLERATQISIYCFALSEQFLESACREYYQKISREISSVLDICDLNNLYIPW